MQERVDAFRNRFPEAPRLAITTLRHFYAHFNIPKSVLFKQSNLKVQKFEKFDVEKLKQDHEKAVEIQFKKEHEENIEKVKYLRKGKRFGEFSDEQILYLISKETLKN